MASDLQPVRQRTQLMTRTHTSVKKSNIYKNILESGQVKPQAHVKNVLNSSSKKQLFSLSATVQKAKPTYEVAMPNSKKKQLWNEEHFLHFHSISVNTNI